MRSIRFRLILGTAVATALILAGSGAAIYLFVQKSLLKEFDEALAAKAHALAVMTELSGTKLRLELDASQMPEFYRRRHAEYFQLWSGDGQVAAKSPSLATADLERLLPAVAAEPIWRRLTLPDGRTGRVVAIAFRPALEDEDHRNTYKGQLPVLVVARDTSVMDRALSRVGWLLVIVCGVSTLTSVASMVWVIRRGLRPVDALAGKIAAMNDSNLADRITIEGTPKELAPVTQRLNELLGRLEEAFSREKAFSANVAHELRTPLAGLEVALEVCGQRPRQAEEYQQTIGKCLQTTKRMHAMVDTLLMLARVEAQQVKIEREKIVVHELLDECWKPFAAAADRKGIVVGFHVDPQCLLHSDREKLRLVLQNLFDNAVSYTNAGGSIEVKACGNEAHLSIGIANSGSRLSHQEAQRVFDRFWRGDAARAELGMHCGLGLTLCKRVVELLGGSIDVSSQEGGNFGVDLRFPVAGQGLSSSFHVERLP